MTVYEKLAAVNVNGHTEKKNGLTYLSWAWAWAEVKKAFPDATYSIYENADGWCYHTDGRTAWVKTGVTIEGIEHIEYLPVMDNRNRSIPLENITSFDVNKAIQRSLTKACARHGLGLYIYAGEDLPDGEEPAQKPVQEPAKKKQDKNEPVKKETEKKAPEKPPITQEQLIRLQDNLMHRKDKYTIQFVCEAYKIEDLRQLTEAQANKLMEFLGV